MSLEYKNLQNAQAFSCMKIVPDVPDKTLMVGTSERLESIPVDVFNEFSLPQQKPIIPEIGKTAVEKVDPNLAGVHYSIDDFDTDGFWLGSILEV